MCWRQRFLQVHWCRWCIICTTVSSYYISLLLCSCFLSSLPSAPLKCGVCERSGGVLLSGEYYSGVLRTYLPSHRFIYHPLKDVLPCLTDWALQTPPLCRQFSVSSFITINDIYYLLVGLYLSLRWVLSCEPQKMLLVFLTPERCVIIEHDFFRTKNVTPICAIRLLL